MCYSSALHLNPWMVCLPFWVRLLKCISISQGPLQKPTILCLTSALHLSLTLRAAFIFSCGEPRSMLSSKETSFASQMGELSSLEEYIWYVWRDVSRKQKWTATGLEFNPDIWCTLYTVKHWQYLCLQRYDVRNMTFEMFATWLDFSLAAEYFLPTEIPWCYELERRELSKRLESELPLTYIGHELKHRCCDRLVYVWLTNRFTMVFAESPNMSMLQWVPDPANPRNLVSFYLNFFCRLCVLNISRIIWPFNAYLSTMSECFLFWRQYYYESRATDVTRIGTSDLSEVCGHKFDGNLSDVRLSFNIR